MISAEVSLYRLTKTGGKMKKNFLCYYSGTTAIIIVVAALLIVLIKFCCLEPAPEETLRKSRTEMVYLPGDHLNEKMPEIKFVRNGKTLLSVKSENGRLCFMEEVWADKENNRRRLTPGDSLPDDKNFDFRKKLLDLHGDGDLRYLFIADMHSGNSSSGHIGYIIDAKNDFRIVCKVDAGETVDIPYTCQDLVFDKQILYLGYFGATGEAAVCVPIRYAMGREPEVLRVSCSDPHVLNEQLKSISDPEAAVTFLYTCFIREGKLNAAKKAALRSGYPPRAVETVHREVIEKIKDSPNRKIIEKINNVDIEKI